MNHEEYYQKFLDKIAPIRTEHYAKLSKARRNKQVLIDTYNEEIKRIFYENYPQNQP